MAAMEIALKLRKAGVYSRVDDSNTSIGKRYARNDELGTPFGLTLDFACTLCLICSASPASHLLGVSDAHCPFLSSRIVSPFVDVLELIQPYKIGL